MARDRGPGRPSPIPKGTTAIATVDITDGPSVEITKDGWRCVREAKVTGLKGSGAARLFWAINATGVPQYGDLHPVIPGLPVSRVSAVLADKGTTDIAIVTCEYYYPTGGNMHFANVDDVRGSSLPQLEITTTVQPATTQFYIERTGNKAQILVPYTDANDIVFPDQPGTVEYQLPMTVFRYMRREPSDIYIGDIAKVYVGTINSVGIFGDVEMHHWMCTRIDGASDDGGKTYNVTYEFQRHPETWNPVVVYVDPATQLPVTDADVLGLPVGVGTASGIGRFRIYKETDFDELNLTI